MVGFDNLLVGVLYSILGVIEMILMLLGTVIAYFWLFQLIPMFYSDLKGQ